MPELARDLTATLFNSLWEATALAVIVWLILRLLPNLNATTRYAAWCIALAGAILLPAATALPHVSSHPTAAQVMRIPAAPRAGTVSKQPVVRRAVQSANLPPFRGTERLRLELPQFLAYGLCALWGLPAALLLVRLALNLWRLERLKSDALPLPLEYRERLAQWHQAEKGERDVRLCICADIDVPVAVGLFDSMILIPQHLLDTLAPEEIDQIMLHELGHLRRADDWTNGFQRVIQALFFFNPAVLFIAQQLDLEREVACDDWVLHQTNSVRPYATCLTKMAEVTAWPHRPLAAPGVFVTRRGLSMRVERLLRAGRNVRVSLSFGAAGGVAAALVMLFFVLQSVAPSYAFTTAPDLRRFAPSIGIARAKAKPAAKPAEHVHGTPQPSLIREKIVYVEPTPRAVETTLVVPATHVHVPARTIRIPAINVDVKEQRVRVVASPVLPADFGLNIARQVQQSLHHAGVSPDFSNQNLSGHSFRGQRLTGADFSNANLQGADFSSATVTGADFSGASLRNANFSNARMTGCDMSGADLAQANFDGVEITGCDFSHARNMSAQTGGALIRGCRQGCDLTGANARGANLRGVRVSALDLAGADLRGADLSQSTFSAVSFEGAALANARLSGATFYNCSFDGVDMSHVDFSGARVLHGGEGEP